LKRYDVAYGLSVGDIGDLEWSWMV